MNPKDTKILRQIFIHSNNIFVKFDSICYATWTADADGNLGGLYFMQQTKNERENRFAILFVFLIYSASQKSYHSDNGEFSVDFYDLFTN